MGSKRFSGENKAHTKKNMEDVVGSCLKECGRTWNDGNNLSNDK